MTGGVQTSRVRGIGGRRLSHVAQHGQPVRVLMLDARACLPILCFVVLLELDHLLHRAHRRAVLLDDLVLRADAAGDVPADAPLAGRARCGPRCPPGTDGGSHERGESSSASAAQWPALLARDGADHPLSRPRDRQGPRAHAGHRRLARPACCPRSSSPARRSGARRPARAFALDIVRDRERLARLPAARHRRRHASRP